MPTGLSSTASGPLTRGPRRNLGNRTPTRSPQDGRAEAIADYLDALERDVARRHEVGLFEHECALLADLSRVMTDATYDRTIALIRETRGHRNHNFRRMFLVLGSRRAGTLLREAIDDLVSCPKCFFAGQVANKS